MYEIRDWLLIGKYRETVNLPFLQAQRIGALLHLAERVEPEGIMSLYIAQDDGEPIPHLAIERGVRFVRAQKAEDHRVLVACGAGISRASSFALAALKEEEGLSLLDAYHEVWKVHPEALPHPALWDSLTAYYGESTTFLDLWEQMHHWKDQQ